jgi:hypothetical protein
VVRLRSTPERFKLINVSDSKAGRADSQIKIAGDVIRVPAARGLRAAHGWLDDFSTALSL